MYAHNCLYEYYVCSYVFIYFIHLVILIAHKWLVSIYLSIYEIYMRHFKVTTHKRSQPRPLGENKSFKEQLSATDDDGDDDDDDDDLYVWIFVYIYEAYICM